MAVLSPQHPRTHSLATTAPCAIGHCSLTVMHNVLAGSVLGTIAQVGALLRARWLMLRRAWVKGASIGLATVTLAVVAAGVAIAPVLADGSEVQAG